MEKSNNTKKPKTFSCICGLQFDNQKHKNAHASQCDRLSSLNPQKRKADSGYHNGAFVRMQSSQIQFRKHIRLRNVMLNDRAVSRSSALHTRPNIPELGSSKVHEANKLVDDEEMMFNGQHDELEEQEDTPGDTRTEFDNYCDQDDESVSSVEAGDSESEDEEPEENDEEEGWEDVPDSTVDNLEERLFKIKTNHNYRWANSDMAMDIKAVATRNRFSTRTIYHRTTSPKYHS